MAAAAGAQAAKRGPPSEVDTLILVDVDGVLNVGAADEGKTPILFNDANVRFARRLWDNRAAHPERHTIEKLVSITQRRQCRGQDESETVDRLAAVSPSHISEPLVKRLANIIEVAGPRSITVLSSTWQHPRHKARVQDLEASVSRHLGRTFEFDSTTGSSDEKSAEGRLGAIGNFVAHVATAAPGRWPRGAAAAAADAGRLRVLVLEDFFITPLSGLWSCGGRPMKSTKAVEDFVRSKLPAHASASVKLIHTYDEWRTDAGLTVRCGVGLSTDDVLEAKEFFLANCEVPAAIPTACMLPPLRPAGDALGTVEVFHKGDSLHDSITPAAGKIQWPDVEADQAAGRNIVPEVSEVRTKAPATDFFGLNCLRPNVTRWPQYVLAP